MPQRQDTSYTTNDLGEVMLAVRKDAAAGISNVDGDYTPLQCDASGSLRVADAVAALVINTEAIVFASAARTVTTNSADQTNLYARGVRLHLDVTAASGGAATLDVKLQAKDSASGSYFDIPGAVFTQKTTVTADDLVVYPGVAETANETVSDIIPRTWRAVATFGGSTPSFTFSLGASYVL